MSGKERGDPGKRGEATPFWKRVFIFLWYDDSPTAWLTTIILAFLILKYVFYPLLGLLLSTQYPVVAVVSSSMEHHPSNFEAWWAKNEDFYLSRNITKFDFLRAPFHNGFRKGDIMVLTGADPGELEKGDVIVYQSGKPYPIIHRYVGTTRIGGKTYLMSKGDNNQRMIESSLLNERRIPPEALLGKAVIRIPLLGWVKIIAVNLLDCTLNGPGAATIPSCIINGRKERI